MQNNKKFSIYFINLQYPINETTNSFECIAQEKDVYDFSLRMF